MKNKLQIGCGFEHYPEYINMDISDVCNPDIQHDIRKGFPMFDDSVFREVVANGVLEMIHPNEEFAFVLNELWRVIDSSGRLNGQVPSTDSRVMGLDPFDKRWFMEETFNYFDYRQNAWSQFGKMYGIKPWEVHSAKINENGIVIFSMQPHK